MNRANERMVIGFVGFVNLWTSLYFVEVPQLKMVVLFSKKVDTNFGALDPASRDVNT